MALLLIVDDDPISLSGLEAMVRSEGFETATAEDLASARVVLERRRPDALLVDINLPDGSGLELATASAEAGIDFILVTGEATIEIAVAALRAGAADFLTKPVDAARLKTLLEEGIYGFNLAVKPYFNASFSYLVNLALKHLRGQAVVGDANPHHTAGYGQFFKYNYGVSQLS